MKTLKLFGQICLILAGNFLCAASIAFFVLPSGLITGGATGIALFFNHLTGMSVPLFVFIFNAIMFFCGLFALGRKFALTTLIGTFFYPLSLYILQRAIGSFVITSDLFLCALFGGIGIGASCAIVFRLEASTGGTDIPPLIIYKYTRIPVSASMYVIDCVILLLQTAFSDREKILYGAFLVLVYSIVLDKLLLIGTNRTQLIIISDKTEEIKTAIISEVDRGVTLLRGKTGYLEKETDVLLSVVSNRELYKVEKIIHQIDHNAFVTLSHINEVKGRGFSSNKKYLD